MKKIGEQVGCEASASGCAEFETQTCKTVLLVRGVYLKRIYASNFGEVEFLATKDRLDLDDYKLNEIKVKDNSGALAKSFQFNYTFATAATGYGNELTNLDEEPQLAHRMFLAGLSEKSKAGVVEKKMALLLICTMNFNNMRRDWKICPADPTGGKEKKAENLIDPQKWIVPKKEDKKDSGNNYLSWDQAISLLAKWLSINPNIKVK